MNEMANMAEHLSADIEHVLKGIRDDPRLGCQFIYTGYGYSGICFPKHVQALAQTAK
jgi:UDPglucose 6-dehydrogenase